MSLTAQTCSTPPGRTGPGPPESFLETILASNASSDAQVFTHAQHPFKIVHVNPAWTRLCGFRSSEVVGLTCQLIQGPETSREVLRELRAALDAQRPTTVRLVNYTKQGDPFLNELMITPLFDETGVTHFMGTLRRFEGSTMPSSTRLVQDAVAESAVAAAFNAQMPGPANSAAGAFGTSSSLCPASRPRRMGGEIDSSPHSQQQSECSDMLLSREAFPLHTLNNHPIAPVLLRMLQLNSSAGRQPAGSKSPRGSSRNDDSSSTASVDGRGACSGMELEGSQQLYYGGKAAAKQNVAGSFASAGASGPGSDSHLSLSSLLRSTTGSSCSVADSQTCGAQQASAQDHQAFLAAVVRQGVLPPASWPMKPRSASPRASADCEPRCGECSDGEGSASSMTTGAVGGVADSGSQNSCCCGPTRLGGAQGAQEQVKMSGAHEDSSWPEASSLDTHKGHRKRHCDVRPPGSVAHQRQGEQGERYGDTSSNKTSSSDACCDGGGGAQSGRPSDSADVSVLHGAKLEDPSCSQRAAAPMHATSTRDRAARLAMLQRSPSLGEQLQVLQDRAGLPASGEMHGEDVHMMRTDSGRPRDDLAGGEEVLQLDDVLDVLDSWDDCNSTFTFDRQPSARSVGSSSMKPQEVQPSPMAEDTPTINELDAFQRSAGSWSAYDDAADSWLQSGDGDKYRVPSFTHAEAHVAPSRARQTEQKRHRKKGRGSSE